MASASKISTLLIFLIFFVDLLSLAISSTQANVHQDSPYGKSRIRRQTCVDGMYDHEGKQCCKCAAGQRVEKHCTTDLTYGQCEFCEEDTYISHPNGQTSCDPCTSCNQPNANLEVDLPCTRARNTRCRCKTDHYCDTGTCKVCLPCTTCEFGVDKACTPTSDAVCKEANNNNVGAIVAPIVIVALLVIGGILVYWFVWRKRQRGIEDHGPDDQPLRDIPEISLDDIQPLLLPISDELGWSVVKEVAIYSKIKDPAIESCERNHPNDNQEQTRELLKIWTDSQGRNAPKELVRILEARNKRAQAEKVREILLASVPV
ncbi:tumor necrosis factor receptor superfamily member 6 [Mugil cephalus]|uniref:tumor necrosis factor receptor superfamily member 6 n=1 Tax=Mugil cephalus TaxID=48193 RepID=UPI001FB782D8|nr:tumor necrosis factor receptor superfamily member 6 [Mugil cephalus]XP_047459821.1 tumor necrosis factor receptor superfamily member 6 [Mugil cephalus]XP_047459822.1 tumor necrosis factor receptor superfamily member 6 [Mugil cephalus]